MEAPISMPCRFSRYFVARAEAGLLHGSGPFAGAVVCCASRGAVPGPCCCQASSRRYPEALRQKWQTRILKPSSMNSMLQ